MAEGAHRTALHDATARWYWRLAYLGLAGGRLDRMSRSTRHAQRTLEVPGNPYAHVGGADRLGAGTARNRGRPLLTQKRLASGRRPSLPCRNRLSSGRYAEVRQQLAALPSETLQRPPFAALAKYWL